MPATLVEAGAVEDAVQMACRAPSLHNSQPWQWVFNRGQLLLFLDSSRVMQTDRCARERAGPVDDGEVGSASFGAGCIGSGSFGSGSFRAGSVGSGFGAGRAVA